MQIGERVDSSSSLEDLGGFVCGEAFLAGEIGIFRSGGAVGSFWWVEVGGLEVLGRCVGRSERSIFTNECDEPELGWQWCDF